MEGYMGFENYKDNKLRLEVGRVYTRRPVIGGKLSFFDNPLDVLRYYPKGKLGCWLVLAEYRFRELIDVKSVQVDGDRIKANTFYRLKNGEFVECKGM